MICRDRLRICGATQSKGFYIQTGDERMQTILLVEDDESLSRGISLVLKKEGYEVYTAFDVADADRLLGEHRFNLVICDITLPDGSGLELGRRVRHATDSYLIYLTALDSEIDIVSGYEAGADDYVTKPFSLMVLVSKVGALMRRMDAKSTGDLVSGDVRVSLKDMSVTCKGSLISLSKKEMQLLILLMEHAGQVMTRESILEHVWDMDGQFVDENVVPVNISRLKNKLGTEDISNIRGLGYIWTGRVIRK